MKSGRRYAAGLWAFENSISWKRGSGGMKGISWSQEKIVLLIAIALFCAFSVFLRGFISPGNLLTLVRSVSTLGILGVGMAILVIGRGIDLAIVAIYAMSAAWMLHLANGGMSIPLAVALGYFFALSAGVLNGVLVAYFEIPALFATLGMASLVYGFARFALVPLYVVYMPASASSIAWIGSGFVLGAPMPILFFALVAFARVRLPAVHETRTLHLRDRRQFRRRAPLGRAGASDHCAAIRNISDDRLSRRHDHRHGGSQHGHECREFLDDL